MPEKPIDLSRMREALTNQPPLVAASGMHGAYCQQPRYNVPCSCGLWIKELLAEIDRLMASPSPAEATS